MDLPLYMVLERSLFFLEIYLLIGLSAGLITNRILWLSVGRRGGLVGDVLDSIIWSNIVGFLVIIVTYEIGYRSNNAALLTMTPNIGAILAFAGSAMLISYRGKTLPRR